MFRITGSVQFPGIVPAQSQGSNSPSPTDNTTVFHYINNLGGTKSLKLCNLTMNLIEWCTKNKIDLITTHIPGIHNTLADMLSTKIYPYHVWELADRVVKQLFQIWNTPQIDLFATLHNRKLPKFCSLRLCPQAEAVDALSLDWSKMFIYAFPPLPLIRQVLMKVEKEPVLMILIDLRWSRRDWYPILLNTLVDFPVRLPGVKDLVTQQKGQLLHYNPTELQLMAWMISGIGYLQKAFHRKLQTLSWLPEAKAPINPTNLVGSISSDGVKPEMMIPLQQLSLK